MIGFTKIHSAATLEFYIAKLEWEAGVPCSKYDVYGIKFDDLKWSFDY